MLFRKIFGRVCTSPFHSVLYLTHLDVSRFCMVFSTYYIPCNPKHKRQQKHCNVVIVQKPLCLQALLKKNTLFKNIFKYFKQHKKVTYASCFYCFWALDSIWVTPPILIPFLEIKRLIQELPLPQISSMVTIGKLPHEFRRGVPRPFLLRRRCGLFGKEQTATSWYCLQQSLTHLPTISSAVF